jgi:hypothetical protein
MLCAVWMAIVAYVLLFYAVPLHNVPATGEDILRRGHTVLPVFFVDEIVGQWFEGATFDALVQRLQISMVAATIFLPACAAGWLVLRMIGVNRQLTKLNRFVFSAGVGLSLASLATLSLGLCGLLERWLFVAIGGAMAAAAGVVVVRDRRQAAAGSRVAPPAKPGANDPTVDSRQPTARWLWTALPFAFVIVLGAMLPPVEFDVREYHLQAPKEFYQAGRIDFLPHNVYANMPLGTEMLSLLGMVAIGDWWYGALVGKTLIGLFAPLTALALYAAGRRFVTPLAGVVAAIVYISIPWIALVSMNGLVDGAMAFYLFAALYALLMRQQSATSGVSSERFVQLGGFMAGSAVATKYPAVLFCVIPFSAWVLWSSFRSPPAPRPRRSLPRFPRLEPLALFLGCVALGCGPWLAKNWILTGNPVYPLLVSTLEGETRTAEKDAQWTRVHAPPNFELSDLAGRAADVVLRSDWLSPLVMPLAGLAFFTRWRRMACWLAAYIGFVFITWWLFTHRIDRFWIPILPVAALLAGMGASWSDDRWWRVPLACFLAIGLLANFVVLTSGVIADNRFLADLSTLRRDPERVNPWHLYLNAHAGEVTGVLLVGDAQPFDLEVPALYNTVFDDSILEQLVGGRSPEEARHALAARNISHVYVDWSEVNRYRSPGNYGITDFIQPDVFDRLVAAGVLAEFPRIKDNPDQMFRVVPASSERASDKVR